MKKYTIALLILVLTAAVFAGCMRTETRGEPTTMPTVMPTTAPTVMPTVPPTHQTEPTADTLPLVPDGTTDPTDTTAHTQDSTASKAR